MRTNGSKFCYNLEVDKNHIRINNRQAITYETNK
jgi:hypothetical protein